MFIDGEVITGSIANYHLPNNILVMPNVFGVDCNVNDASKTKIKRISWNFGKS